MDMTLDFLKRLTDHGVQYVVVGGLAATLHGSSIITEDVDVCAPMTEENIRRIHAALLDLHPKFRMRPDRTALPEDPTRLFEFKNLNLETDWGQMNILEKISGVGDYEHASVGAAIVDIDGRSCRFLGLDELIRAKKAAARPKDLLVLRELEAIRQRKRDADEAT